MLVLHVFADALITAEVRGKQSGELFYLDKGLISVGLTPADQSRASYAFLAAADPATRTGVVAGWLTDDRGSGIVTAKPAADNTMLIEGRVDYGKLLLNPKESTEGELFAIGHFDDSL